MLMGNIDYWVVLFLFTASINTFQDLISNVVRINHALLSTMNSERFKRDWGGGGDNGLPKDTTIMVAMTDKMVVSTSASGIQQLDKPIL